MTKEEIKTRIEDISKRRGKDANSLLGASMAFLLLHIFAGVISIFTGMFILGIACFFLGGIIYFLWNGFAAIIANTHKTAEYAKLRLEILAEGTTEETYDNSLPTL